MNSKLLRDLMPGERGVVLKVSGKGSIRRRILDMGVIKGAEVEMERVAPLGDPVEVKVKGCHLSFRKVEAGNISVVPVKDNALGDKK